MPARLRRHLPCPPSRSLSPVTPSPPPGAERTEGEEARAERAVSTTAGDRIRSESFFGCPFMVGRPLSPVPFPSLFPTRGLRAPGEAGFLCQAQRGSGARKARRRASPSPFHFAFSPFPLLRPCRPWIGRGGLSPELPFTTTAGERGKRENSETGKTGRRGARGYAGCGRPGAGPRTPGALPSPFSLSLSLSHSLSRFPFPRGRRRARAPEQRGSALGAADAGGMTLRGVRARAVELRSGGLWGHFSSERSFLVKLFLKV